MWTEFSENDLQISLLSKITNFNFLEKFQVSYFYDLKPKSIKFMLSDPNNILIIVLKFSYQL